ncbi:MAG TPA: helix-turn-helix domain-containing protein [Nitrososphaera sp.]|nr:helix-turn-helix domain-containing protein [Nitrososphaera sp.]
MTSEELLLGGRTRFRVIQALAEAKQPVTAYQVAITTGLDSAATYRCLMEFANFGIVESEKRDRNQTIYKLSNGAGKAAAEFLHSILQKKSEPNDLEEWISPKMRSERMAKIMRLDKGKLAASPFIQSSKRRSVDQLMSKRTPGELTALIKSSKIAFDGYFFQEEGSYVMKEQ